MQADFRFNSIRDPLYGYIDMSETEIRVIDSSVFRRLLNIKQLSHAFVVYPAAIHTRFEHSLGVMHLADRVCTKLGFDDEKKEIVRLAALLHDVGHGPYSHLFESVLSNVNGTKVTHEKISMMIIKSNDELGDILGDKVDKIASLLDCKPIESWERSDNKLASDVVSGPLDVDRMDYLLRDSYHIGVAYGHFDLDRIIHTLDKILDGEDSHICVQYKGKDAVESYRLGRYLMHSQVYQHHARLAADQMFVRAANLAVDEGIIPKEKLKVDLANWSKNAEFLEYYLKLDDKVIYDKIIGEKPNSSPACLLQMIQQRKLFKRACEILVYKEIEHPVKRNYVMKMQYPDLHEFAQNMATQLNLEHHRIIAYLAKISVDQYGDEILILWKGKPKALSDLSPISARRPSVDTFYVFSDYNGESKNEIKKYTESEFDMSS